MTGSVPGASRRLLCAFAALLAGLAQASAVAAWDNQGHMATGAIAYDLLKRQDPRTLQAVLALVAQLPQRERLEAGVQGLSGQARDRATFEYLARWPDDIRRGPLDHPEWHYAVHVVSPGWTLIPYTAGRARQAFDAAMATLENRSAAPRDRAVAAAWIIHLAGDTQQPLHAGNRLAPPVFWKTDRAGTIGYVRRSAGAPPIQLHEAWDGAADLPGPEREAADALAARLEEGRLSLDPTAPLRADPDAAFRRWWCESYALAQSVAYQDDALKESPTPAGAPVLSAAYQQRARTIAQIRLRQAGVRIATSLAAARP